MARATERIEIEQDRALFLALDSLFVGPQVRTLPLDAVHVEGQTPARTRSGPASLPEVGTDVSTPPAASA